MYIHISQYPVSSRIGIMRDTWMTSEPCAAREPVVPRYFVWVTAESQASWRRPPTRIREDVHEDDGKDDKLCESMRTKLRRWGIRSTH